MREFYVIINEYPWTTVLLCIYTLLIISGIVKIIKEVKQ